MDVIRRCLFVDWCFFAYDNTVPFMWHNQSRKPYCRNWLWKLLKKPPNRQLLVGLALVTELVTSFVVRRQQCFWAGEKPEDIQYVCYSRCWFLMWLVNISDMFLLTGFSKSVLTVYQLHEVSTIMAFNLGQASPSSSRTKLIEWHQG